MHQHRTATPATSTTNDTSCGWCGRPVCPERFDHDRLRRSSETAWRTA
jgi:hypothetical protein